MNGAYRASKMTYADEIHSPEYSSDSISAELRNVPGVLNNAIYSSRHVELSVSASRSKVSISPTVVDVHHERAMGARVRRNCERFD